MGDRAHADLPAHCKSYGILAAGDTNSVVRLILVVSLLAGHTTAAASKFISRMIRDSRMLAAAMSAMPDAVARLAEFLHR